MFSFLDWDPSEYPLLQKTILSVEKFKTLWHLALNFHEKYEKWYYGPFKGLETGVIQKEVEGMYSTAVTSIKTFHDTPQARRIAETVRAKVEKFRTYLPILHTLCNPGMYITDSSRGLRCKNFCKMCSCKNGAKFLQNGV